MNNDCRRSGSRWFVIVCGVALACGACAPADKEVGSACKNGVCPAALGVDAPVCLASAVFADIKVASAPDPASEAKLDTICLPQKVVTDGQGKAECQVVWRLLGDNPVSAAPQCPDLPFLTPDTLFDGEPDSNGNCSLAQISKATADAGTGDGWFYDEVPNEQCSGPAAVHFVGAAQWPQAVTVSLICSTLQVLGAPSDAAMCVLPPDSSKHTKSVGDPCQPKLVPDGGFTEGQSYVESGATECGTGACLIFHLQGDPSPGCKEIDAGDTRCADPDEVDKRVYCSCRCDAPAGVPSSEFCDCPHGFACVEVMAGPEAFRGGYCLRHDNTEGTASVGTSSVGTGGTAPVGTGGTAGN